MPCVCPALQWYVLPLWPCRLPETCAMGALAEVLHRRFKLDGERLSKPGTAELAGMYLFSGKNAGVYRRTVCVCGGGGVVGLTA